MSLKKKLQGLVAALAVTGGFASSASAVDSIVCTAGNCTCKFDWNVAQDKDCKPPAAQVQNKRANRVRGITEAGVNNYTSQLSLVTGTSASAIPITSGGTLFPEFCRATDQVKDGLVKFKGCSHAAVPSHVRVLVGP